MPLFVRILMLVAAFALGATPAAAHGPGFGGPGSSLHCSGMAVVAEPGDHDHSGGAAAGHGHGLAAPCICAMLTTLAEAPITPVPLPGRAPRRATATPALEGLAAAPEPPPPRA